MVSLKKGLVKTYNRYEYEDEKQEAMVYWEKELLRIIAVGKDKEKFLNGATIVDAAFVQGARTLVGYCEKDLDTPRLPEVTIGMDDTYNQY